MRVEPDIVNLLIAVSQIEEHPKDAFTAVRATAKSVRDYLAEVKVDDVASSQVNLTQQWRYRGEVQEFVGYKARVEFNIILNDINRLEEILVGVVDAGANEILSSRLQTTKLKEYRAEARHNAINAAREKALNYCTAAGVSLGTPQHIDDQNPDNLTARHHVGEGHHSYATLPPPPGDDEPHQAFDPGSIVVAGAVKVWFEVLGDEDLSEPEAG